MSLIFLLPFNLQAERTLFDSGRVIFRVDDQVYLDREVIQLIDQVNAFLCAFPQSQMQALLNWKAPAMQEHAVKLKNNSAYQLAELEQLMPAILVVKLLLSVKSASVVVLEQTQKLFAQSLEQNKCWKSSGARPQAALDELLKAEVFLRARLTGEGPTGLSDDQLKGRREALLSSWQTQFPHQFFSTQGSPGGR